MARFTRVAALRILHLDTDTVLEAAKKGPGNVRDMINDSFRTLIKKVHPDTTSDSDNFIDKGVYTIEDIKAARNVLINWVASELCESSVDDDICERCLGHGVVKKLKGFIVVDELCECVKIKNVKKC